MTDLREIINKPPFEGRLVFLSNGNYGEILKSVRTVYTDSTDLFNCRKIVNNRLIGEDITFFEVDTALDFGGENALEGALDVMLFFNGEAVNRLREGKAREGKTIAVLRGFDISGLFTDRAVFIGRNGKEERTLKKLDKVVVDFDLPSSKKSGFYADAFCRSASFVAVDLENKLRSLIGLPLRDDAKDISEEIVGVLSGADEKTIFGAVVRSQVLAARWEYLNSLNGTKMDDVRAVAEILKRLSPRSSMAECRFSAAKALVEFYGKIAESDIKNNIIMPRYNERLQKLTVLFGALYDAFTKDFAPFTEKEVYRVLDKLCKNPQAVELCKKAAETVEKLNSAYLYLYGGRKKRTSFTRENVVFAIREGGYLSEGLLKFLSDGGITEALG